MRNKQSETPSKKSYRKPGLRAYGSVAELTAGGSGNNVEGMTGKIGMADPPGQGGTGGGMGMM